MTERLTPDNLREEHALAAEAIRNNPRLSLSAKQQRLAKNHVAAQRRMADLVERTAATTAADQRDALQRAFASDGDVIASRRARKLVADITTARQARQLLEEAENAGDDSMAAAVAAHAYRMRGAALFGMDPGWSSIVNDYAATRPAASKAIETLEGINTGSTDGLFANVVPLPHELIGVHPTRLAQLADDGNDAA